MSVVEVRRGRMESFGEEGIGNVNGLGELASSHSQKNKLVCDIKNIVLIVINCNPNCIFFLVKNNNLQHLSKLKEQHEMLHEEV